MISFTPLRRSAIAGLLASSALFSPQAALANDTFGTKSDSQTISVEQTSQYLHYSAAISPTRMYVKNVGSVTALHTSRRKSEDWRH